MAHDKLIKSAREVWFVLMNLPKIFTDSWTRMPGTDAAGSMVRASDRRTSQPYLTTRVSVSLATLGCSDSCSFGAASGARLISSRVSEEVIEALEGPHAIKMRFQRLQVELQSL